LGSQIAWSRRGKAKHHFPYRNTNKRKDSRGEGKNLRGRIKENPKPKGCEGPRKEEKGNVKKEFREKGGSTIQGISVISKSILDLWGDIKEAERSDNSRTAWW